MGWRALVFAASLLVSKSPLRSSRVDECKTLIAPFDSAIYNRSPKRCKRGRTIFANVKGLNRMLSPYLYRRLHMVFVGLGALPFVIWRFRSYTIWPDASVAAYLLTAWLLLTLMIGYPGPGNRWYWKPVAFMVMLHTAVLCPHHGRSSNHSHRSQTSNRNVLRSGGGVVGDRVLGCVAVDRELPE